jgi:uncharacterized protein YqfA (UPF0365 family)
MKRVDLPLPLFGFAVATRVALGVGIGLLVGGRLRRAARTRIGASLIAFGAVTTVPVMLPVFGRKNSERPKVISAA